MRMFKQHTHAHTQGAAFCIYTRLECNPPSGFPTQICMSSCIGSGATPLEGKLGEDSPFCGGGIERAAAIFHIVQFSMANVIEAVAYRIFTHYSVSSDSSFSVLHWPHNGYSGTTFVHRY